MRLGRIILWPILAVPVLVPDALLAQGLYVRGGYANNCMVRPSFHHPSFEKPDFERTEMVRTEFLKREMLRERTARLEMEYSTIIRPEIVRPSFQQCTGNEGNRSGEVRPRLYAGSDGLPAFQPASLAESRPGSAAPQGLQLVGRPSSTADADCCGAPLLQKTVLRAAVR
jgi:hypothetical protein